VNTQRPAPGMPTLPEASLPAEYLLAPAPRRARDDTQIGRFGPMQAGTLAGHGRRAIRRLSDREAFTVGDHRSSARRQPGPAAYARRLSELPGDWPPPETAR
jgi:hypothetical protein